jgi:hypothetical protein
MQNNIPLHTVSSFSLGSANRIGITKTTKEKVYRNKTSNRIREKLAFMRHGQAYTIFFFVGGTEQRKVSELFRDAAET